LHAPIRLGRNAVPPAKKKRLAHSRQPSRSYKNLEFRALFYTSSRLNVNAESPAASQLGKRRTAKSKSLTAARYLADDTLS